MDNLVTSAEQADSGIELCDVREACRILGGTKPINPATLYRGVKDGRYPKPVHPAPGLSRWVKAELLATVRGWLTARDDEKEAA